MIYFLGDVHGNYDHILPALESDPGDGNGKTAIFLGDLQAQRPFEDEIRPLIDAGIAVWFIHGNHDTDTQEEWDRLQPSWHRNLHGRVVEIEGQRIAGLGGVFRGEVWMPENVRPACLSSSITRKHYDSFAELEKASRNRPLVKHARAQQALKHASTIFPNIVHALQDKRADILVTHEAPSCHLHGFREIDVLAAFMRAKRVFHGHHHDSLDYGMWHDSLGFRTYGVGFCGILDMHGRTVLSGDFDEARRYRQQHPVPNEP